MWISFVLYSNIIILDASKMQRAILSKSSFLKGLQCDKHLYLYKHQYNLQDPIDEMQQAVFDRGHKVGDFAQQLFPSGINVKPSSPRKYMEAVTKTRELIDKGEKIIYEASFIFNEVLVYADILVKCGNHWCVYEVKSSTSVSDTYIMDVSVQYYVISNSGLQVEDIAVVFINNEYIRLGELDINKLFTIHSLIYKVRENQKFVSEEVERLKGIVKLKESPQIDIGEHCTTPYKCSFKGYCWNHIPSNTVFDISRMTLKKKFEMYKEGIILLNEIPSNYALSKNHKLQVDGFKSGGITIDKEAIREFLNEIDYPLYFMDFETFQPAIPLYDHSRPYQLIPFQYSVHFQKSKDSKLTHHEFLGEPEKDPRIEFITSLLKVTETPGGIIVYNKSFEITRLKEIARDFPKYATDIGERIERVVDLMIPFQKKFYYHPRMDGSYSIKKVLPALIPELSYDELEISEGGSASIAFEQLLDETDLFKIHETRNNLLDYCKLDTFAMVELLDHLYKIVE